MWIYTKEELFKVNTVEIYKIILRNGLIKEFPVDYWEGQAGIDRAIECSKYLFEDVLKYNEEQLKKCICVKIFKKYKLGTMLKSRFKNNIYKLINKVYPNKFKEWEFKYVYMNENNFTNNAVGVKAVKWLIEEKLKLSDEELKEQLSCKLFNENGLDKVLKYYFNCSPYEAVNAVYPNKFKAWEFRVAPRFFWDNKENGIKATKWLIEEKLKLSDDELTQQISYKLFKYNGLGNMLNKCFDSSPYKAINAAYPNKFKEYEFRNVPNGHWDNEENAVDAIRHLIESRLKLTDKQLKKQLSLEMFKENGLINVINRCFGSSPYKAINAAYPNKFKEWEFNSVPRGYWDNKENAIIAIKWLVEEKLKLSDNELTQQISYKLFKYNGLGNMLKKCFGSSTYKAINAAYPNKFKEWEIKSMPKTYWINKNNRRDAIKWLIEDKLNIVPDKEYIQKQLSYEDFINSRLDVMLKRHYNNHIFNAINEAYPNKFKKSDFKGCN